MTPKTRSGGKPAPSRVYHSTPGQRQAQFPARRTTVRTYGKQNRKKQAETPSRLLRQQTLTQIDFVSSFEGHEDPIVLSSDSEADEMQSGQGEDENQEPEEQEQDEDEDQEPVSSGRKRRSTGKKPSTKKERTKRRRTIGDDTEEQPKPKKEKKSSRRKTMGDVPSSDYHTQTLTQFLGRDPTHADCIKDSEDEDEDDEFQQWLGNPTSPSPQRTRRQKTISPIKNRKTPKSILKHRPEEPAPPREESAVPETPQKQKTPHKPAQPTEIPSSSQLSGPPSISSTPASMMLERYGAPDRADPSPIKGKASSPANPSPLKELKGKPRIATTPKQHERIIQDSYATASWDSINRTPLKELPVDSPNKTPRTPKGTMEPLETSSTSSAIDDMETPTKSRRRRSTELGGGQRSGSPTLKMKRVSPGSGKKKVMLEIPDSEDEEDENFDGDENNENALFAGAETQLVMGEIASSEEEATRAPLSSVKATRFATKRQVFATISSEESSGSHGQASISSLPPLTSSRPTTLPPTFPLLSATPQATRRPRPAKRVRKPIHRPLPPTQTQPLESQRVPLATLQALPPASARTDVLLPLSQDIIDDVLEGYHADLILNFKIPAQVVRFWLYDGELLRFMACADPGRVTEGPAFRYHLTQVYELNNPVEGDDMQEEGWIDGDVGRYVYFPPAVVGQLLWNLRHALFKETTSGDEPTQTQAIVDEDDGARVDLFANSSQALPTDRNPTATSPTSSMSESLQLEAQLQRDFAHSTQFPTSDDILVPSTPEEENNNNNENTTPPTTHAPSSPTTIKPPPRRTPRSASSYRASRPALSSASKRPAVRPSQATTVSQASTPEKQHSSSIHRPPLHSSSSIGLPESLLEDDDDDAIRLSSGYNPGSSQLLTKSQMLPDSLIRDDTRVPPEIWDSDDDDNERL
ncbi:hypothetical protein F53441_4500 [Fusarium austroafricanum]|uniref:Uncharacterized protein n=1 Tax=Fusarium austroafricanum TaxID=2364996 RepID=A0A8H4KN25_9HYPO|nr:hypothetical protein F53441_4500 [Fusarium austroafricanum]